MDLHDCYLQGVSNLLKMLNSTSDDYLKALTLQGRLAYTVSEIRQYGPTESARAEIARVITALDRLCLADLGKPFRSFCQIEIPYVNRSRVCHNLPQPDYGRFIGRERELKQIMDILRSYPYSQEHLVTIDGIGGIGKSALALEVAYRCLRDGDKMLPEDRFEAIIWTSAKVTTLTADGIALRQQITRTLDDIYTTIAIVLQREDITRSRPEEQDEIGRRALINQRTLLIVDNLETIDDRRVNAFLRELPAPTKCIVTTRHRIDVAYPIRLTEMSYEDAVIFIAHECDKRDVILTDMQTDMIYHRTSGVPLAIVWSIAQLGYGYGIESVLHRLGQPHDNIAQYCFEGAMNCIRGTDAYRLLAALALIAADVNRESLGYVAGLGEDVFDRDEGLVQLEKLSLVNKSGSRFDMLPLTRQFVQMEISRLPGFALRIANAWADWLDKILEFQDSYWTWFGAR
ncbi:MAG: AAA family ATPase [Anaerolineae bacterium]|nr:AAA family ATPase [Anaerolineae bacterium]